MNNGRYDIIYHSAWWLCVVTLPWAIQFNSVCIIFLAVVWLAEGKWNEKWQRLKKAYWILPFVLFFALHLVGLFYSQDLHGGLSEIEKKMTFVVLPLISASGKPFDQPFLDFLKKSFVHSCAVLIVGSMIYTAYHIFNAPPIATNFDTETLEQFRQFNPAASPLWEYFSYIHVGSWMELHPAYFSLHIFSLLILLERILEEGRISWFSGVLILLFTVILALLASRMAIFSFVLILTYFLLHQLQKRKWIPNVLTLVCVLISFLGLILINPVSRFRVIQEPNATSLEIHKKLTKWNSVNLRLLEWRASWNAIKGAWLTGVGTGDGQDALRQYYTSFNSSTMKMDFDSHNQYLQTMLELGTPGLISLLLCLFLPALRPGESAVYLGFVALFSLMCLTECMLARQKGIVFFTLFQSLFLNVRPTTPR